LTTDQMAHAESLNETTTGLGYSFADK